MAKFENGIDGSDFVLLKSIVVGDAKVDSIELDLDNLSMLFVARTRTNRRGSPSSLNKVRPFYNQSAVISFCFRLKNTLLTICPHCN